MAVTLIRLQDDTLVEVDVPDDQATPVAGGFATKIDETVDAIRPALIKICRPIINTWNELNKEMHIEQAEVEFNLIFDWMEICM